MADESIQQLDIYDPSELAAVSDNNRQAWVAAREQLFDGRLMAWLSCSGHKDLVAEWETSAASFENDEDAGLEAFLHLVAPDLAPPQIRIQPPIQEIQVEGIDLGDGADRTLQITNPGRGHLTGSVELNPPVPGISVEPYRLVANGLLAISTTLTLRFNTSEAPAGHTTVEMMTNIGAFHIPVSFAPVFPRHATMEAIEGIRNSRDQSGAPYLYAALLDSNPQMRASAAEALGQLGSGESVHRLEAALHDQDPTVRRAIAMALGNTGLQTALRPLERALRDDDLQVREAALGSMERIDPARASRVGRRQRFDNWFARHVVALVIFSILLPFYSLILSIFMLIRFRYIRRLKMAAIGILVYNIAMIPLIVFAASRARP